MSSHYNTEPLPTASATLQTTAGPLHISLFAKQTPLACKNFLQHCLDDYYTGTIFHRVDPEFVIQGGDPTGTGAGGASIYEDPEFEWDNERIPPEKVVFKDEIHSRLRFNRRGLVGMAKSEDGSYGSQFFITLANTERELNGTCTLFGRIEGESIYNVVRIAEAELVEGTQKPVYVVRVTGCEVGDLGPFEGKLSKRQKIAAAEKKDEGKGAAKKKKKGKAGKALLSFGGDEEEGDATVTKPTKPKFNSKLVSGGDEYLVEQEKNSVSKRAKSPPHKRQRTTSPAAHIAPPVRKPASPDPYTQMPPKDPEEPSRFQSVSPDPPVKQSALERTNAEIAALKASMRRDVNYVAPGRPASKSALESMIPETSIRGRKRPAPGAANGSGPVSSADREAMTLLNAFKAKLEGVGARSGSPAANEQRHGNGEESVERKQKDGGADDEDEEAQLCDLHFIANCQSCKSWDDPEADGSKPNDQDDDNARDWMSHILSFGKDTLGKDLNWKKRNEEADSLVVIDPREKEKEIIGGRKSGRDRERERKRERGGEREWDRTR